MRLRIIFGTVILVLMFSIVSADDGGSFGLLTGNLTSADVCGYGVGYIGGSIGIGDEATTFFGSITYGFSQYTEGRFKLGLVDPDYKGSEPGLLLGFDFKYEFLDYYDTMRKNPFDMAFGAFLEYGDFENGSVLELGGNIIGSIPYKLESGAAIVPYARLNLRMENFSAGEFDDTDIQVGLNLGGKFEVSSEVNIYGEVQVDGNTALFLGAEMRAF